MSEINFISSGKLGDVVEFGLGVVHVGSSSITISCEVRNKVSKQTIISVDEIVFVAIDAEGRPKKHGLQIKKFSERALSVC
jgi:acyl-CoA hydrolase